MSMGSVSPYSLLPVSISPPDGYNEAFSKHPMFTNTTGIRTSARVARAIPSAPSPQAVVQHHPPAAEIHLYSGREDPQAHR